MALTVSTNTGALMAQAAASSVNKDMESSIQRLSTGKRINSASDDAAGVAIASRMEASYRGLNQAIRNATDAQALINTAEGAQIETTSILQRMRELAVQSINDTNSTEDRLALNNEITQLQAEITRIADTTTWAGIKLLDGTFVTKSFQVGDDADQTLTVSQDDMRPSALGAHRIDTTAVTTAASTTATETITETSITVLGKDGSAAAAVTAGDSAKLLAGAINTDTSSTGVTAKAHTAIKMSLGADPATTTSFTLTGGGTAVSIVASVTDNADLTELLNVINTNSSTTGVTAEFDGTSKAAIILREADGDDITIEGFAATTAGSTAITATITKQSNYAGTAFTTGVSLVSAANDSTYATGVVRMESTKSFTYSGSTGNAATGYTGASTTGTSSLSKISALSVSSQANAEAALGVIDGAIQMVNNSRGALGAYSNRLDSTISNLTNISNETQASAGRITDADFAAETTALAKAQILQQASTAMLAQANASKQNVLSLLQG
ncbi:flagellin [Rhodobacteraceae bacterium nBUS_22]